MQHETLKKRTIIYSGKSTTRPNFQKLAKIIADGDSPKRELRDLLLFCVISSNQGHDASQKQ